MPAKNAKKTKKSVTVTTGKATHSSTVLKALLIGVGIIAAFATSAYLYVTITPSNAAGCVGSTYQYTSKSSCVTYIEQMLNGITYKYENQKFSFSKEALVKTSMTVDTYYAASTKTQVTNFQKWGYNITADGVVRSTTWSELCAFSNRIFYDTPDPLPAVVSDMWNAYHNAGCKYAKASSNPNAKIIAPTGSESIHIGSWNSYVDNTGNVGDYTKTLLQTANIIGLQEVHHLDQRERITANVICESCAYAGYMHPYTDGLASASSYPIIWNKSKFIQAGEGQNRVMSDKVDTTDMYYATKYAAWVRLKSVTTGAEFYVINTHTVPKVEAGGKPQTVAITTDRYKTHMQRLVALINELKPANIPIFITGDFNVNYRYDQTGTVSYFPYNTLKAVGVRSNWYLMNLSGISSTTGTHEGGSRIIDYVWSLDRKDVYPISAKISSNRYGSDHSPVFFNFSLAQPPSIPAN